MAENKQETSPGTVDFLPETTEGRKYIKTTSLKSGGKRKCQPRIPYRAKTSFRNKGKEDILNEGKQEFSFLSESPCKSFQISEKEMIPKKLPNSTWIFSNEGKKKLKWKISRFFCSWKFFKICMKNHEQCILGFSMYVIVIHMTT